MRQETQYISSLPLKRNTQSEHSHETFYLPTGKCLGEKICKHIFSGAVYNDKAPLLNSVSNKMVTNIDMFGARVIIVRGHDFACSLVVAIESGRRDDKIEDVSEQAS